MVGVIFSPPSMRATSSTRVLREPQHERKETCPLTLALSLGGERELEMPWLEGQ
jgi:hypothetical protein